MSALRDEIRAILREEIAALRSEALPSAPEIERARITSSAELNRFARDLLRRAAEPEFAARVTRGELIFELSLEPAPPGVAVVTGPSAQAERLDKTLITERDIANLGGAQRSLRIGRNSRLTPLARDEARRRGIRIHRTER